MYNEEHLTSSCIRANHALFTRAYFILGKYPGRKLHPYLTSKKETVSPATDNKEMNKLNNLQLGFPLLLMMEAIRALWPGYMRKHPQVLKI